MHYVVEIGDQDAGMTFAGRSEIVFDSEMQFDGAGAKPRATAGREGRRLIDLNHSEHADEKASGILLRIPRHCQLHMVKPVEGHRTDLASMPPSRHRSQR